MRVRPSGPSRPDVDGDDAAGARSAPSHDGDRELYDRLSDEEFADHAFEVLAIGLVGYAHGVLHGWMATGEIYRQAGRRGWPVSPTDAERLVLYAHPEEVDEIINETLGEGLVYLRRCAASGEGKWDPAGGASLCTYFVGACVLRFPTVFRRWSRDIARQPPTDSYSDDHGFVAMLPSPEDLEQKIVSEILAEEKLNTMPPNVRRIVELRTGGCSFAEIARHTGATSARAIEGVLKRYRDGLHRRHAGERR